MYARCCCYRVRCACRDHVEKLLTKLMEIRRLNAGEFATRVCEPCIHLTHMHAIVSFACVFHLTDKLVLGCYDSRLHLGKVSSYVETER
jgi:hypothetical protein